MADKSRRTIGQRLKKARGDLVWSQADLERESGVPIVTISRIENDHSRPQQGTVRKLAWALGVNARWLLTGMGPKAAKPADKDQ